MMTMTTTTRVNAIVGRGRRASTSSTSTSSATTTSMTRTVVHASRRGWSWSIRASGRRRRRAMATTTTGVGERGRGRREGVLARTFSRGRGECVELGTATTTRGATTRGARARARAEKTSAEREIDEVTKKWGLEAGLWKVFKSDASKSGEDGEVGVSRMDMAKKLLKRYGSAYLLTSISLSLVSITVFYFLVAGGVDVAGLLEKVGITVNATSEQFGTFALAYAAHKGSSPIRFGPTVALTPLVAKWLGKEVDDEGDEDDGAKDDGAKDA